MRLKTCSIPKWLEYAAATIHEGDDFCVGQQVYLRTWTVHAIGPQQPIVWKRPLIITDIIGDRIWCGSREFEAFELIPSQRSW